MEQRRAKPKADIEFEIKCKMAKSLECAFVNFPEVVWNSPDEAGCNWHIGLFGGNPHDCEICRVAVLDDIRKLQAQFNIFDPE